MEPFTPVVEFTSVGSHLDRFTSTDVRAYGIWSPWEWWEVSPLLVTVEDSAALLGLLEGAPSASL